MRAVEYLGSYPKTRILQLWRKNEWATGFGGMFGCKPDITPNTIDVLPFWIKNFFLIIKILKTFSLNFLFWIITVKNFYSHKIKFYKPTLVKVFLLVMSSKIFWTIKWNWLKKFWNNGIWLKKYCRMIFIFVFLKQFHKIVFLILTENIVKDIFD